MAGNARLPHRSLDSVLDEPWDNPKGTENEIKRQHRACLPDGFPDELSRESLPATGSIGAASMPIRHREPPFKLRGGR